MSTTYQITSAQITGFIASNLSQLEEFLAADLELLYKESAPEHFDYEYCRNELRRHLDRQDSQLQGLCLLFLDHPEIRKEIYAAMDALKQLYQVRFSEVQALAHPKEQNSADQSSLSSLAVPPETLEDSTVETADALDQGTNSLGSRYISYSHDEPFPLIFESSKLLFNVIDNSLDSIPEGDYKERCRELRTAVSLVFHFHMDRFGGVCRYPAQSLEALIQGVNQ